MGFRRYDAAISLSAVSTHSFSAFVYYHSTSLVHEKNNCVWRIISIFHGCIV